MVDALLSLNFIRLGFFPIKYCVKLSLSVKLRSKVYCGENNLKRMRGRRIYSMEMPILIRIFHAVRLFGFIFNFYLFSIPLSKNLLFLKIDIPSLGINYRVYRIVVATSLWYSRYEQD